MLFPVLYLAAKRIMGVRTVSAQHMDFVTNVAEFDAMTLQYVLLYCRQRNEIDRASTGRYDDPSPQNKLEAFWMWLVRTASSFRFVRVLTSPSA